MANEDIDIKIKVDDKEAKSKLAGFAKTAKSAGQNASKLFNESSKQARNLNSNLNNVKTIIGAIGVAKGISILNSQLSESVSLAKVQIQAEQKLESVLKATGGAAGLTANELKRMSKSLQSVTTFGDEAYLNAQALMLTFTQIGKDVFPTAIEAAADMSKTFGQDLQQSVIQLGTALNDPIAGVGRLRRIGISFSETQKDQIEKLMQQNDLLSAQKVILDELQVEFGGTARALAETDVGKIEQLTNEINDFKEEIGTALLPAIKSVLKFTRDLTKEWQALLGTGEFKISKELVKVNDELSEANQQLVFYNQQLENANKGWWDQFITIPDAQKNIEKYSAKVAELTEKQKKLQAEHAKALGVKSPMTGGGESPAQALVQSKPVETLSKAVSEPKKDIRSFGDAIFPQEQEDILKKRIEGFSAFMEQKQIEDAEKAKAIEEKKQQELAQIKHDSMLAGISAVQIGADAVFQIGENNANAEKQRQIESIKNSSKSEKEKEKAIEKINIEAAKKDKKRAIGRAVMNGALGATKTIANLGFPAAIPGLIITAAMTAANIAVIASQKFATGGVVKKEAGVPATGDKHVVRVNPGERILTSQQNEKYERMLNNAGSGVVMGDTNIVINGNADSDTISRIERSLADHRARLRTDLQAMTSAGQLDFLQVA